MTVRKPDRFWNAGREALIRAARARIDVEARSDRPPRPGDLLLFAETATFGVLWVVVEAETPAGPFLLAAADANPLSGSGDLEVPASAACGALTVRCEMTVRFAPEQVASGRRIGALEPETVDRMRAKRAAIEARSSSEPLLECQIDDDPETRDWVRRLAEAREILRDASRSRPEDPPSRA